MTPYIIKTWKLPVKGIKDYDQHLQDKINQMATEGYILHGMPELINSNEPPTYRCIFVKQYESPFMNKMCNVSGGGTV